MSIEIFRDYRNTANMGLYPTVWRGFFYRKEFTMNKTLGMAMLVIVTGVGITNVSGSNSSWRDRVASERGYDSHQEMEAAHEKAREADRYWQQRESERQESEAQRERERTAWDENDD